MLAHDVPFSSQYADLGHHEWRARGCGITALKMVMDFWHASAATARTAPLDEVLKVGLEVGAHREGIGWTHRGLVEVADRFGYDGFNADLAEKGPTPKNAESAWAMLVAELERGPVLASVYGDMNPESMRAGHIVVVTGFADGLVAFNNPEEMTEREGRKLLALESFLRGFKRRYIIIRPRT